LKPLTPEQLSRNIDVSKLGIKSTEGLERLKSIIGQKRAVSALRFGLQIEGMGYNIYVSGPPGTGKMTSVKSFLDEFANNKESPPDWCYVNNFDDIYSPQVLRLPAGTGTKFREDMDDLIEHIRRELPKAFESEQYAAQQEEIMSGVNKQREEISEEINKMAEEKGFQLKASPMGVVLYPVKDGEPIDEEEFQNLSQSENKEIEKNRQEIQNEMKSSMKKIRKLEQQAQEKIKQLDRQIALHTVGGLIDDLKEKYEKFEKIPGFLDNVQKDIIENIDTFKAPTEQQNQKAPQPGFNNRAEKMQEIAFQKYKVNVLVDNSKQKGAPVIVELNPTYNNLIGRIEKEMQGGALNTDFTMLRAGSLPRANGGYLVIPIEDLLRNFSSYDALKRSLCASEVQIEELSERLGFMAIKSLRPQAIPLDVKVILVGQPLLYYLLHAYDNDFPELFKIKADYDTQMSINDSNIDDFVAFISTFCEKEKLKHLDASAVGRLMSHAIRLTDDQEKLSTKFGHLADLIREANFWAKQEKASLVEAKHVQKALDEKIYRSNLVEERIREMIERGTILLDTDDEVVGQVNGLSFINLGDYQFGKPNRITATVSPGREGVTDIEREVELGGPIHSKGVLILSGYLTKKYAQESPLTLASRVVFEQSYGGVDGDSASSAELYAILSALSDVPIKQGIAVTGSINQNGQVQAIGGVNQKIEGFFEVCRTTGLTGEQGVIIPQSNVKNLVLREEVIQAVKDKKFHIWPVETVDQGIEILTGVPAGASDGDGKYQIESVNEKVRMRLRDFETAYKDFRENNGKQIPVTTSH